MIKNAEIITICHKWLDTNTRLETWTKHYYKNCWWFDVGGSVTNKGYQTNNTVTVRIPYKENKDAQITDISIGDILYRGKLEKTINSQADVPNAYNITAIANNTFGKEPHIRLGGN